MKAKKAAAAVSAAALCLGSMSAAYIPAYATETGAAVTTGELRDAISDGSAEAEIPASDDPDTALIGTHEKSADETRTEAEVQSMVKESGSFSDIPSHYGYENKGTLKGSQLTPGDIVTFRATQTSTDPTTGAITTQKADITCIYVEFTAANGLKTQQLWKVSETGDITEERNVNVQADYYSVWHVEKKPAAYTAPTGLAGTKRKTLSTVALPSGFSWKSPDTVMSTEGTQEFDAIYTPDNDMLYTSVELKISVSVQTNIIPLTRPEDKYTVYYEPGQTLSSISLPEGWAFENPSEVLKLGSSSYEAVFTGDKNQDYSVSTDDATVTVEVIKRSVAISPISLTVTQGTVLTNSLLPGNAFGTLSWEKPGQKMSEAGTFTVYARFTPSDSQRYASQSKIPVTVTVKKKAADSSNKKDEKDKDDSDSKKNDNKSSSSGSSSSSSKGSSGTLDITPSGDNGGSTKSSAQTYEPAAPSKTSSGESASEKSSTSSSRKTSSSSDRTTSSVSSSSVKKKTSTSVSASTLKKRDPSPLNINASQITTLSSNQRMLPDLTAKVKKTSSSSSSSKSTAKKDKKDAVSDVVAVVSADTKKKTDTKKKDEKTDKTDKTDKSKASDKTTAKDTDDQTAGASSADTSDEFAAEETTESSENTSSKKKASFFSTHRKIIAAAAVAVLAAIGAAVGVIVFRKRSSGE